MKILLVFILCLSAWSLWAQERDEVYQLNEVRVEAEAENNALEEQKEALPSKIVISSKDLNNFGNHTVGDVLKRLPRIFVQGPPSFNRNIMMGGLDKQFQTILIDGNRPAGGEDYRDFKLDRIPADMVEEIEIIYNPPAEWGADAAMGVVNIKLKDIPEKEIFVANMAIDHTSTHEGINPDMSLTFGNNLGRFSFIGSYSYNTFNRTNLNELSNGEIEGTETEDIHVNIHGFTGTANYKFNDNTRLKYKTFLSNYHEDLDFLADIKLNSSGELRFTADTADDTKLRRLQTHTLELEQKGDDWRWTQNLTFGRHIDQKDRWRMTDKTVGITESFEDEDQENNEVMFRSDFRKQLGQHHIKSGLRASGLWRDYARFSYSRIAGNKFWDDITDGSYSLQEYRTGVYFTDEIELGSLFLVPSIRFDHDARAYQSQGGDGEFQYASLNPSLHAKYILRKDWSLKADAARQLSRPPFNAQVPVDKIKHKKATIERGNPELLPSLAYNVSGGIEHYFEKKGFVTMRGFYSVLRDVIEKKLVANDNADYPDYTIIQSVNVDSGLVWGLDFDTRLRLLKYGDSEWSFAGNATLFGSQVRDASTGELRRLNEQPEWITNMSIDYLNTKAKIQFSVGVNYVGKRYIAGGTDEGTLVDALVYQPYMQVDARLKYFFKPWGSIFVNAMNLTDEVVETRQGLVNAREAVGRNVRIGVNLTL